MLLRVTAVGVLLFGLFSSGCDAGRSTLVTPEIPLGDVSAEGSDDDVGAEDGLAPTPVELHGRLQVVGSQIVDESGDPIQLKGVSSMWLNWESQAYAENPTALRWMRNNWKLSVIRAAMGVDVNSPGVLLNDPDLAKQQVYTIVDNAIAAGVYVLVDFHSHHAHEHFADAAAFFSEVSAKYAGVPNVIYETFNEPTGIGWADLKKYHEAIVGKIREQDPDALIVLGTTNYSQNVDQAAADPLQGNNLLYTLHYYSCTHGASLRQKGSIALNAGIALFVTEWGATDADGGTDGDVCLEEAQRWDDWMNEHQISWSAWKLDGCEPDSTCLLMPGAPVDGGWTNDYLHGHARFVRGRMQQ